MMKQYMDIKEKNKGTILFFRLGDFYEMFFDDAKLASRELELTLTARDCGQEKKAPMCGVPYHSSESYIARLVAKGYKVAICEQMEDPATTKGLVKRDVTRVITPGTVIEGSMLDETKNNFICSLFIGLKETGLCFCDISTGELFATYLSSEGVEKQLRDELGKFGPREILIGGDIIKIQNLPQFIRERLSASVEMLEDERFDYATCKDIVLQHFRKENLNQLGLDGLSSTVSCLGALLTYLKSTQKVGTERINKIEIYTESQYMQVDLNTKRNLELTETMRTKEKRGSLLWVLDKTKTAMGKRLMRTSIEHPLVSCVQILRRQNAVEELFNDFILRDSITEKLIGIFDIERLMTKVVYGSANARDLRSLLLTFERLPKIKSDISKVKSDLLVKIHDNLDTLDDIRDLIENAIVDEPPFSVREGGMIKKGYNKELDELQGAMDNGQGLIASVETREKDRTGIPKLKIGYNRVFGYYIEVTNSYKNLVPEEYIRKQTLANCERYITQELKELEVKILGAKDKSIQLEYILFNRIREKIAEQLIRIQDTAKAIAQLDMLCSLAHVAAKNNYCRPEINIGDRVILKDSRHPVVEELLESSPFVPNDLLLDENENRVSIITGPNMAGKSTYMRQTALIVLMAQVGSFVPAASAEIGIIDKIFTRVGASDDLASGQSTFMIEMTEVANIIEKATHKSLLILDEIGRGTSTFDGMSIARAVLEFVADKKKLGAKTLFATHYHELTELEDMIDGVKNYNIAVKKRGDDITFLRRIVRGGADDSYGIEVAKLAGIPESIVLRAKQILKELETEGVSKSPKKSKQSVEPEEEIQLSIIPTKESAVEEKLKTIDVNTITPIEAMTVLFELSKMVKN